MSRTWAMLLLLACVGSPCSANAEPRREDDVAGELSAPAELVAALPPQAADRRLPMVARVQAIVDFMATDGGLALHYREQPTWGIAESYARREVNCLSYTLLFVAIARASGIHAHMQASDEVVAAQVRDGMLYRNTHMNAGIEVDGKVVSVDVGSRDLLAGREPTRISDRRALALLHNNRAVEWMLQGNSAMAYQEMDRALELDPSSPASWNNAGVIHARSGHGDQAESAYLRALELDRGYVGALGNLVRLYRARGAYAMADAYDKRLGRIEAHDPFSQYVLGQQRAEAGAYDDAIAHYRRAIRLLPRQPAFFRGLAEAYRRAGNIAAAQRADLRAEALEAGMEKRRAIRDASGST